MHPDYTPQSIALYLSRVRIAGPAECWEWGSGCHSTGYGAFCVNAKNRGAHRVMFEITHGPIPDDMFVCHHCDNPLCCNPAHLFLADNTENQRDASRKGRSAAGDRSASRLHPENLQRGADHWQNRCPEKKRMGSRHHNAKLTEDIVREARRLHRMGEKPVRLAERYKVSLSTMCEALNGKTWPLVK